VYEILRPHDGEVVYNLQLMVPNPEKNLEQAHDRACFAVGQLSLMIVKRRLSRRMVAACIEALTQALESAKRLLPPD
jgi:hypothetical protein